MKKLNKVESKVLEWNRKFPLDAWWRRKHGIAFMSEAHKEISFLDQLFEFYEDKFIHSTEEEYIPNKGDFLKQPKSKSSIIEKMREEFEREFLDG